MRDGMTDKLPDRQIRARQTASTLTVYQAYSPHIARPALEHGRFVAPFKRSRMTWIKPSFLWMAYRSGWATKPDQEMVLAIEISRDGFEWALEHAALSHHEAGTYASPAEWAERKDRSPVRVQWDPERDLRLQPLPHRSIQVGLSGEAVDRFVDDWITSVADVTATMVEIDELVQAGQLDDAARLLPDETVYPLRDDLAAVIGASRPEDGNDRPGVGSRR